MNVFKTTVLVLALAAATICGDVAADSHYGVQQIRSDPLASVPASRRERLRQRLHEFLTLQVAEDYRGSYSYFSQIFKASFPGGLTIDAYLKTLPSKRILRFTPEVAIEFAPGHYMLDGCAEYERFGPNLRLESGIEAVFEQGDWYFSEIDILQPCIHCRPRGCKLGDLSDTAPN